MIAQEWIAEGITMLFLAALVAIVTALGAPSSAAVRGVYSLTVAALVALAILTEMTGARLGDFLQDLPGAPDERGNTAIGQHARLALSVSAELQARPPSVRDVARRAYATAGQTTELRYPPRERRDAAALLSRPKVASTPKTTASVSLILLSAALITCNSSTSGKSERRGPWLELFTTRLLTA